MNLSGMEGPAFFDRQKIPAAGRAAAGGFLWGLSGVDCRWRGRLGAGRLLRSGSRGRDSPRSVLGGCISGHSPGGGSED